MATFANAVFEVEWLYGWNSEQLIPIKFNTLFRKCLKIVIGKAHKYLYNLREGLI